MVDRRNPQPDDAARFVHDDERLDSAIDLPGGDLLLAVSSRSQPWDLCSATLQRVVRATGARSLVARGREPQLSPDGRSIVFAAVGQSIRPTGPRCVAVEVRWGPIAGPFGVVPDLGSSDEAVSVDFMWSPDGTRVLYAIGWYQSELAGYVVLDVRTGTTSSTTITSAFAALLDARASGPCRQWALWPKRWLTDGSLVGVVLCTDMSGIDITAIPWWWWHVPPDGVLSSFDWAVTDEVLLRELPERGL